MLKNIKLLIIPVAIAACVALFYGWAPGLERAIQVKTEQKQDVTEPKNDLDVSEVDDEEEQAEPKRSPTKPPVQPEQKPEVLPTETEWQKERALQEQRLHELVAQLKSVDEESPEYYEIDYQIFLQMKLMGLTEFHKDGYDMTWYPPKADEILEQAKELDPESQFEFRENITSLEQMAEQRAEILSERKRNTENNQPDSPELLEKFYKLQAQEMATWDKFNEQGGFFDRIYQFDPINDEEREFDDAENS